MSEKTHLLGMHFTVIIHKNSTSVFLVITRHFNQYIITTFTVEKPQRINFNYINLFIFSHNI
jgi:hypothetical protein